MKRSSKELLKCLSGCGFMLLGVLVGAYVGIYLMLVCGIAQVVEAMKANPVSPWVIAWGIARIVLCPIGWVPVCIGIIIGKEIVGD